MEKTTAAAVGAHRNKSQNSRSAIGSGISYYSQKNWMAVRDGVWIRVITRLLAGLAAHVRRFSAQLGSREGDHWPGAMNHDHPPAKWPVGLCGVLS
jgi:hypothetical protein